MPLPDEVPLDVPRMWVEFPDPAEIDEDGVPNQVIRADLTWLTSHWTCLFGRGCQGVYATRPDDGCCTLGAHFAEPADEERVRKWASRLSPQQWQFRRRDWARDVEEVDEDGEVTGMARATEIVDGACVFLNRPGFPGGEGCALHGIAMKRGIEPLLTKPEVCWQLPIRREYRTVERGDFTEYLEVTITEYTRRVWGNGGHELDWYCTGLPAAHIGAEPVYVSLRAELIALIGEPAYAELVTHCESVIAARRPSLPLAEHPATTAARRAAGA